MCINTRKYIRDENSLNYHLTTVTSYESLSSTTETCDTFVVHSSDSSPSVTSFVPVVQKVLLKSGSDQFSECVSFYAILYERKDYSASFQKVKSSLIQCPDGGVH